MSAPAIPPTVPPSPKPRLDSAGAHPDAPATNTPAPAKVDHAVISKDGREALAKDSHGESARQAPAKGLNAADAAFLGQSLKRSNPVHFKQADTNGDGKLSAAEARAAGLG